MKFKNDVEIQNSDLIVGTDIYTTQDTLKVQAGGTSGTYILIDDQSGEVVVSADISADNLSGTNTGDQNLSGYVTLNTTQTISGTKTFTSPTTINGGVGVSTLGGTLIVRQKGNSANDGIAITSAAAASHRIWKASDGKFHFGSSTQTTAFTQLLDGSVGIGTNDPQDKLEVQGSIYATPIVYSSSQDAYALRMGANNNTAFDMGIKIKSTSAGSPYMSLRSHNTEDLLVLKSGNVGIGTDSPDYKLDINANSAEGIRLYTGGFTNIDLVSNRTTGNLGGLRWKRQSDSSEIAEFLATGDGGFSWNSSDGSTQPLSKMFLTGSGNLGIKTNNPQSELHVTSGDTTETTLIVGASGTINDVSSRIFLSEGEFGVTNSKDYGFSLAQDGQGSNYGLPANTFGILRHNNNATGVAALAIGRVNGYVGINDSTPSYQLDVNGVINSQSNIYATGTIGSSTANTRDKLRVWNSGLYAIGMKTGYTFGGLGGNGTSSADYAMSFQMNGGTPNRGFYWGTSSQNDAKGAMALTNEGKLTVADSIRLGYGETDTVAPGITYPLEVNGDVKATGYINQRVAWNAGYAHTSNNVTSWYYIPVGYIAETPNNTYYNNWAAQYGGRVKKVIMRNTGSNTVPTATTIAYKVTVNGTTVFTSGYVSITGTGNDKKSSYTFTDTDATFNEGDRVQVSFNTNGNLYYTAVGISLEYTE